MNAPRTIDLTGKRIVISGSSRGLGRAFATAVARAGASVVINGRDRESVDVVVAAIEEGGGQAVAVVGSVSDDAVAERMVASAVDAFGGIDVAIANAAVTRDRTLLKATEAEFDETIAVNLRGAWSLCRHAARAMVGQGGQLLLIPSGAAFTPSFGQSSYAASKAGLFGLMYTIGEELAVHGIRVNAFGPTAATDMTATRLDIIAERTAAEGRMPPPPEQLGFGAPEDVADAVVFLCSDSAAHLCNQFIRFNGRRLSVWRHPSEAIVIDRDQWDPVTIGELLPLRQEAVWQLIPGAAVSVNESVGQSSTPDDH